MKSTVVDESLSSFKPMYCSREYQASTRLIQQYEKSTLNYTLSVCIALQPNFNFLLSVCIGAVCLILPNCSCDGCLSIVLQFIVNLSNAYMSGMPNIARPFHGTTT